MVMFRRMLFGAVLMVTLCTGCSNYSFSRAMYDGVQTRNQLSSTPAERAGKPELNYHEYESERKR
jgi:hypothetical protein